MMEQWNNGYWKNGRPKAEIGILGKWKIGRLENWNNEIVMVS